MFIFTIFFITEQNYATMCFRARISEQTPQILYLPADTLAVFLLFSPVKKKGYCRQ